MVIIRRQDRIRSKEMMLEKGAKRVVRVIHVGGPDQFVPFRVVIATGATDYEDDQEDHNCLYIPHHLYVERFAEKKRVIFEQCTRENSYQEVEKGWDKGDPEVVAEAEVVRRGSGLGMWRVHIRVLSRYWRWLDGWRALLNNCQLVKE